MYDFTIITVCFNSEKTILETIESVFKQKEKIQYLIIDGASNDKTLQIAQHYKNICPDNINMEIYSEKDTGIYNAMNKGIKKAKGKIIGIINSDDQLTDDALSNVLMNFKNFSPDIIHGNVLWKYDINETEYFHERKGSSNLKDLYNGMTINHPTVFCKKEVYGKLGLFDETYRYVADWIFCTKFIDSGLKVNYIDKILVIFSMEGVSNQFLLSRYKEILRVYNLLYKIKKISTLNYFKNFLLLGTEGIKSYLIIKTFPSSIKNKISKFRKRKLISEK